MNGFSSIKFIANGAGPFLRKPGFAGKIKQPANVKAWLVSVVVNSFYSGKSIYFFSSAKAAFLRCFKYFIQAVIKFFLSDFINEACRILGNIKSILNRVSFLEASPGLVGIKFIDEGTILIPWMN